MSLEHFAAIDVEIASRNPLHICAIGVARFMHGREVTAYRSLVRYEGIVRYKHVHGLGRSQLSSAPQWSRVWPDVLEVLGGTHTIVAYRATFDRAALLTMSARFGLRLPRLRFVCAAELMARHRGAHGTLSEAMQLLGLTFPGQPHDPLADARAAAMIAIACERTVRAE